MSKRLTAQQLVMASSGALVTGTVMLSHDNRLGLVILALAAACALAAFVRWARDRDIIVAFDDDRPRSRKMSP